MVTCLLISDYYFNRRALICLFTLAKHIRLPIKRDMVSINWGGRQRN